MKGFENLYHQFTDAKGRNYYTFASGTMPFVRYQQQREFLRWMQVGQSESEYLELIDNAAQALTQGAKGLTTVSKALNEMKFRINTIRPNLVYQMMAVSIVREDENPLSFHREIQEEKAKMIEEDMTKEMEFFFALKPLMPLLSKSPHTKDSFQSILKALDQVEISRTKTNTALERHVKPISTPTPA